MADRKSKEPTADETAVLEKIETMFQPDPAVGKRLHEVIMASVPELKARLWYGMPGYALGKSKPVLCFIRQDNYLTFGLTEKANFAVEEGASNQLMPSSWFFTELDEPTEQKIADIVRRATT